MNCFVVLLTFIAICSADFEAEIRKVTKNAQKVFNERKDPVKYAKYFDESGVLMPYREEPIFGLKAITEYFVKDFKIKKHLEIHLLGAFRSGNFGYAYGTFDATIPNYNVTGSYVTIFRKHGTSWKAVNHISTPVQLTPNTGEN